jgi:hypothetical protein
MDDASGRSDDRCRTPREATEDVHGSRQGPIATVMETPMPAATIHVEPTATGRWIVRHGNELESLSEHDSATDAQRVACELAHLEGTSAVLLHDRYARVHRMPIEGAATTQRDRRLERHQRTE